jgi:hypothetical protein
MHTALGITLAPATAKKAMARAALVDVKDSSRALLTECFRQFGVEAIAISSSAPDRLCQEKFAACVVPLAPGTQAILEAARSSPSNSRVVLYGLGGSAQEAMRYSKYGINAMFQEPLERPATLKLVRATHNLILHEFRRYARIPIMTEVTVISSDGARLSASSLDVSSGGMSLRSSEEVSAGASIEVSFSLHSLPRVNIRSTVTWRKTKSFGLRFDPSDDRRHKVKQWIDSYLDS